MASRLYNFQDDEIILPAGEHWGSISSISTDSRLLFGWFAFRSFAKAAFANDWMVVLAGQVQFALALIALLFSESMSIVPTAYCKTEA